MRIVAVGVMSALLCACSLSPAKTPVRVTAFSQGLVGPDASGQPQIYERGDTFTYRTNGTCVADGRRVPCMWYGFEVSFEGPDDISVLNCTTESTPITAVDPSKTYGKVSTLNWPLTLRGRTGHFLNPQYVSFPNDGKARTFASNTTCLYEDVEVMRWRFIIESVPPNNAFQPTASLRSAAAERGR